MALPLSRNTTYAPGSAVKSADLNELQDDVIGAKHGAMKRNVHPSDMYGATNWAQNTSGYWTITVDGGVLLAQLPCEPGDRIRGVTIYGKDAAGGQKFQGTLLKVPMLTGTKVSKSNLTLSAGDGTDQALSLSGVVEEIVADGDRWEVTLSATGMTSGTLIIRGIDVVVERP